MSISLPWISPECTRAIGRQSGSRNVLSYTPSPRTLGLRLLLGGAFGGIENQIDLVAFGPPFTLPYTPTCFSPPLPAPPSPPPWQRASRVLGNPAGYFDPSWDKSCMHLWSDCLSTCTSNHCLTRHLLGSQPPPPIRSSTPTRATLGNEAPASTPRHYSAKWPSQTLAPSLSST